MNFFALNERFGPYHDPIKIFQKSFRRKGPKNGFTFSISLKKTAKFNLPGRGIEPGPPRWKAGVVSNIPRSHLQKQTQMFNNLYFTFHCLGLENKIFIFSNPTQPNLT